MFSAPRLLQLRIALALMLPISITGAIAIPAFSQNAVPPDQGRSLTLRSDIQEANSQTGIVTARGNVQIYYPARQIQATAAQAQYFSRERRIVLSGNVYVLQQGNSLRGETITYLIDEGRFVALPQAERQVEAIYIIPDPEAPPNLPPAYRVPLTSRRSPDTIKGT
uniref:LptA/OstA family protein n=1 Tax=Desertifilum tharense IPPAS B-1220 TaxID=1781255 RepID=A0ACD5H2G7_9CYAN